MYAKSSQHMSSSTDNNSPAIYYHPTIVDIKDVDVDRISLCYPRETRHEFWQLWPLEYIHLTAPIKRGGALDHFLSEKRWSGKEFMIKGYEMYSRSGIVDVKNSDGTIPSIKRRVMVGYIAADTLPEHALFKLKMEKIVSYCNGLNDVHPITNPVQSHGDDKLNYIAFKVSDRSKFYDVERNPIDLNTLSRVTIKFIPTFHIETILVSSHICKFIISLVEATVTHIGSIDDELPEHFESLNFPVYKRVPKRKEKIKNIQVTVPHIDSIDNNINGFAKPLESLKIHVLKSGVGPRRWDMKIDAEENVNYTINNTSEFRLTSYHYGCLAATAIISGAFIYGLIYDKN